MGIVNEEYFPRGGATEEKIKKKKTYIFEKGQQKQQIKLGRRERNKNKPAKPSHEPEERAGKTPRFIRSSKVLNVGTITLCSIKTIRSSSYDCPLVVSIPGRCEFEVSKKHIPWFNLNMPQEGSFLSIETPKFEKVFKLGAHLCCKVISLSRENNQVMGQVSLEPSDINGDIPVGSLKEGDKLFVAVKSVEDHVYVLTTGIHGSTALLQKLEVERIRDGNELEVGESLWCVVQKIKEVGMSKTIEVTIDTETVSESFLKKDISIKRLNPGTSVKVSIVKIFDTGCCVKVLNTDIFGFIETSHLESPSAKPLDLSEGTTVKVTVLCKISWSNLLYFTFRTTDSISENNFKIMEFCPNAKVVYTSPNAIHLELPKINSMSRGLILKSRLGESITEESIVKDYPEGMEIKCYVLGYDFLEQVYLCSITLPDDVPQPGDFVKVKIKQHRKKVCLVDLGKKGQGFIPYTHLRDSLVQNPISEYPVGSIHNGRILSAMVTQHQYAITLKETLLVNPPLIDSSSVEVGGSYYGVAGNHNAFGLEVFFYQDFAAIIPLNELPERKVCFRAGDLVKCIAKQEDSKIVFSLIHPERVLKIGDTYTLEVVNKGKIFIETVILGENDAIIGEAVLPRFHVSDHETLSDCICKTFKRGSKIEAVLYSMKEGEIIFSLRESVKKFFEELEASNIKDVKPNMQIPCTVVEYYKNGAILVVPLPDFNEKIYVENQLLFQNDLDRPTESSVVVAQVLSGKDEPLKVSCLKNDVKVDHEWKVSNLCSYLKELSKHQTVRAGERVEVTVSKVGPVQIEVESERIGKGVIKTWPDHKEIKEGTTMDAVVLFWDPPRNYFHMVFEEPYVNPDQEVDPEDFTLKENIKCTVFNGNDNFMLGVADIGDKKGQLIYIPLQLHPNSIKNVLTYREISFFETYKVKICSITEGFVIGVFKKKIYNIPRVPFEKKMKIKKEKPDNEIKIEGMSDEDENSSKVVKVRPDGGMSVTISNNTLKRKTNDVPKRRIRRRRELKPEKIENLSN